mmetsp:Transcript_113868/g.362006  ORF Transcript_113868/g.362006 Transcript_113868/m.362006 type:complete len:353 (-) Transcript_113868:1928-2986(-)
MATAALWIGVGRVVVSASTGCRAPASPSSWPSTNSRLGPSTWPSSLATARAALGDGQRAGCDTIFSATRRRSAKGIGPLGHSRSTANTSFMFACNTLVFSSSCCLLRLSLSTCHSNPAITSLARFVVRHGILARRSISAGGDSPSSGASSPQVYLTGSTTSVPKGSHKPRVTSAPRKAQAQTSSKLLRTVSSRREGSEQRQGSPLTDASSTMSSASMLQSKPMASSSVATTASSPPPPPGPPAAAVPEASGAPELGTPGAQLEELGVGGEEAAAANALAICVTCSRPSSRKYRPTTSTSTNCRRPPTTCAGSPRPRCRSRNPRLSRATSTSEPPADALRLIESSAEFSAQPA